ncbi:MAG: hypothetical protein ACTSU5_03630, partial [Promethearchaeota archaeon]
MSKSRKDRLDPQQFGSLLKATLFPVQDISNKLKSDTLVHVLVFQDAFLTIVNLGYGFLCVIQDLQGFPIAIEPLRKAINQITPVFPEIFESESQLLKELSIGTAEESETLDYSTKYASEINSLLEGLSGGVLEPPQLSTSTQDPNLMFSELLTQLPLEITPITMVVSKGGILGVAGSRVGEFDANVLNVFNIPAESHSQLKTGRLI